MTIIETMQLWRERLAVLEAAGAAVDPRKIMLQMLAELEQSMSERDAEVLNLTQAAAESGYSPDHLARLIRNGKLASVGRRGSPKIRRADLPRRPSRRPLTCTDGGGAYDPATDARTLWSRPTKGGSPDG